MLCSLPGEGGERRCGGCLGREETAIVEGVKEMCRDVKTI